MDSVREGEGGKIWENGIETCKISCMKRVASPGSMHDTGCLGLVHWDNPEGWNGEGGGRRVQEGVVEGEEEYLSFGSNLPINHIQVLCWKKYVWSQSGAGAVSEDFVKTRTSP